VSSWHDFAAGISGCLQHDGRGHLERLDAHVIQKWCHCSKRVWNNFQFVLYIFFELLLRPALFVPSRCTSVGKD